MQLCECDALWFSCTHTHTTWVYSENERWGMHIAANKIVALCSLERH